MAPGLQACIEHVEDGLALTADAVNGLGIDTSTQSILLDQLMGPIKPNMDESQAPVAIDKVLEEVRNLSSAINALVDKDV